MNRYRVGIVGATGLVGQRLVERLDRHPWFELRALAASDRSAGKPYDEAANWQLPGGGPPAAFAQLRVRRCRVDELDDCDLVLSALDAEIARELEPAIAGAGIPVVSNSSAFRQHAEVPLVVPEVNPSHLELIDGPRRRDGGYIVTNPNCSTTGLVVALAPLHRAFGVSQVVVTTMQAASGAGLAGPTALQLLDNVLPHIPGEEQKMEREVGKILGRVEAARIEPAPLVVSAHCHRVPTIDGHLEAVSVKLAVGADLDAVRGALLDFRGAIEPGSLPSAKARPLLVRDEDDRPQPRLDRDEGSGMTVVVGRLRRCPVLDLRFVVLSHNTVRGAAGGTLLNAELLAARELLPRRGGAA
ncbi:MAG TPA: aspartate-semialdehyde dehydrogenase [Candidatus Polarisedimenticolaceae bacterium]|nr:aspartate-semialdehyde dehydrogenase [Candidatus Polarisedimenticolaceae bacterium]